MFLSFFKFWVCVQITENVDERCFLVKARGKEFPVGMKSSFKETTPKLVARDVGNTKQMC